jgi:hypothetical protein
LDARRIQETHNVVHHFAGSISACIIFIEGLKCFMEKRVLLTSEANAIRSECAGVRLHGDYDIIGFILQNPAYDHVYTSELWTTSMHTNGLMWTTLA